MDADGLKALFEPFGAVTVKRMFSGHGVYADGLCFAISLRGEVFLKTNAESEAAFAAADSSPFVYDAKGKAVKMPFWRLPAEAYDDPDALCRWASLGLEAARRAAEAKAKPKTDNPTKGKAKKGSAALVRRGR